MSFGFSVGDFITVIKLANKIRKEFVDAPSQFRAISDEVRSLSIILLDVEVVLSDRELRNEQEAELKQIANGCRNILDQLEHTLDEYDELKSGHGSVGKRVKRVWKRLKWEPEDIKQLRSRISTNIGLLNAFTSRLTRDNVVTLVRSQEDQGRQTILDWITPIDYALQQSDFISRRQAGTGQWLVSSAEFKAWVETDKRTLFCPGIPGAGKTILTSIVVEELFTRFENDANISIAYLYCNYRRQHEQNLEDLFASLLKQFVQEQPSIPDSVKTLYDRHKDKRTRPSLDEILRILQTVAAAYSRVFIIVDALDECQISDGCRQRFLLGLFNFQVKCGANLFATSRPISSIEKEFDGNSRLEIRASEEDVRRYLDRQLFRLPGFVARSHELQEEIKTDIVNAVDGMFLLAQLYLDSLIGKRSPKAVQTALKNLITGSAAYDHAYEDVMERINGQIKDQEELAKQVLLWITCAERPLTIIELQHAIGVEVGESQLDEWNLSEIEDIISVCAGLVTIDKESGIIRLVHYTTQEYFERTQRQWFPDAQTNISTICVTYLSFDKFESGICQSDKEFEERLQSNKLYDYAAHNWGHHAREASVLIPEVASFLKRKAQLEASSQGLLAEKVYSSDTEYSQRFPNDMTGLHLAAFFGVEAVVKLLLEKGADLAVADSDGRTPLYYASNSGYIKVVKLLLEKGVDLIAADSYGWMPLHHASSSGRIEIVKLLLEKEADPVAVDSHGWTSLYRASGGRYIEIVKLLLKKGADPVAASSNRWTPLYYAFDGRYIEVVKLLLEKGADLVAADSYGWTLLYRASGGRYIEIVKLLLEKGVDLAAANSYGWTPLRHIFNNGHVEVVKLLLEKGADPAAASSDGWTPLYRASSGGHVEVVKLLLEKGVDPAAADSNGWTSLYRASSDGYIEVVKLLLEKGANLAATNSDGWTPLYHASNGGYIEVIKLLLEKEADPVAANSGRWTSLYRAFGGGCIKVVKLLLEKEADPAAADSYKWTLLYRAFSGGYIEIIKLLLEKKADLIAANSDGWTSLYRASNNGHVKVVKLLLEKGADPVAADSDGWTSLYRAFNNGYTKIVKLLLEKGADPVAANSDGWTSLYRASDNGHVEVVKLMLEKGADVEAKDTKYGQTPLLWAAASGHKAVVTLLLDNSAVIGIENSSGWTALQLAAFGGHEGVEQLLGIHGALEPEDFYGLQKLFL